jgi:response regulator RpfG family c-di-GMP phosphodiesterase
MLQNVILIDDSDADLLFTEVILQRAEVCRRISTFGTAEDALAYLLQADAQSVDVILLDINMPEQDGFGFLTAFEPLRAERGLRAVVVMLTSSPDAADRERAFSFACVRDYLIKPIDASAALRLQAATGEGATPPA